MDVPTRQAYVVSIVPPAERAGALALTGSVRGVAQAVGPVLAGIAIQAAAFGVPFFAGGGLKIAYDVSLYALAGRTRQRAIESSSRWPWSGSWSGSSSPASGAGPTREGWGFFVPRSMGTST